MLSKDACIEAAKLALNWPSCELTRSVTLASDTPAEAVEERLTLESLEDESEAWSEEDVFFSFFALLLESRDL